MGGGLAKGLAGLKNLTKLSKTLKDANGNPVDKNGRKVEPLKSPTARVLIKPFVKLDNGKLVNDSEVVFGVENRVYGSAGVTSFVDTVVKWADNINDSHELEGAYVLFPGLYNADILDDTAEFDELMWELRHEDNAKAVFYKIRFD